MKLAKKKGAAVKTKKRMQILHTRHPFYGTRTLTHTRTHTCTLSTSFIVAAYCWLLFICICLWQLRRWRVAAVVGNTLSSFIVVAVIVVSFCCGCYCWPQTRISHTFFFCMQNCPYLRMSFGEFSKCAYLQPYGDPTTTLAFRCRHFHLLPACTYMYIYGMYVCLPQSIGALVFVCWEYAIIYCFSRVHIFFIFCLFLQNRHYALLCAPHTHTYMLYHVACNFKCLTYPCVGRLWPFLMHKFDAFPLGCINYHGILLICCNPTQAWRAHSQKRCCCTRAHTASSSAFNICRKFPRRIFFSYFIYKLFFIYFFFFILFFMLPLLLRS